MTPSGDSIDIIVGNRSIRVMPGITVAAALANAGVDILRRSATGEPRGVLCAMGVCQECRLTVDGVRHRKACQTKVVAGMVVDVPDA